MSRFLLCLTLFIVLSSYELGEVECENKYSKKANEPKEETQSKNVFRIQQINLVWEKAQKKLDKAKLKNLFNDLKRQDKEELSLKRIKADGNDKDGAIEGEIRRKFKMILNKYQLDVNEFKPTNTQQGDKHENFFKDKKLNKLWEKASIAGFGEQQLKALKEEIREFESKLEQYRAIGDLVHEREQRLEAQEEASENHIDTILENEKLELEKLKQKLKETRLEMKDEYRRLESLTVNMASGEHRSTEFEEAQVAALWNVALKTDFTAEELEALRDELQKLQIKVQKHAYFKAQLEKDKLAGKKQLDGDNQIPDDRQAHSHQKQILTKIDEIGQNIDKMKQRLEERILRRHSEL